MTFVAISNLNFYVGRSVSTESLQLCNFKCCIFEIRLKPWIIRCQSSEMQKSVIGTAYQTGHINLPRLACACPCVPMFAYACLFSIRYRISFLFCLIGREKWGTISFDFLWKSNIGTASKNENLPKIGLDNKQKHASEKLLEIVEKRNKTRKKKKQDRKLARIKKKIERKKGKLKKTN